MVNIQLLISIFTVTEKCPIQHLGCHTCVHHNGWNSASFMMRGLCYNVFSNAIRNKISLDAVAFLEESLDLSSDVQGVPTLLTRATIFFIHTRWSGSRALRGTSMESDTNLLTASYLLILLYMLSNPNVQFYILTTSFSLRFFSLDYSNHYLMLTSSFDIAIPYVANSSSRSSHQRKFTVCL